MLPFGYELSLVRTQLQQGVGIFACNEYSVISNTSIVLSPGPPVKIVAEAMQGSLQCGFGGEFNTALNSEIFFRVWLKVIALARFRLHDWTVKMDPDAVFLPGRLRSRFASSDPKSVVYINNCDEGLHGPIEVISNGGMRTYAAGIQKCRQRLEAEWMSYGEDVWLRHCLGLLGVNRVDAFDLLREKACRPFKDPVPCVAEAVAFHPLKTPQAYFACLAQAESHGGVGMETNDGAGGP